MNELTPVKCDMVYQANRHFQTHMQQWPNADPVESMADIRRLLAAGSSWLWPEPTQMELFK